MNVRRFAIGCLTAAVAFPACSSTSTNLNGADGGDAGAEGEGAGASGAGASGAGASGAGASGVSGGGSTASGGSAPSGGSAAMNGAGMPDAGQAGGGDVPCTPTDTSILFGDLAPAQHAELARSGVEIFGPADLVFVDDELYGVGMGVAGGLSDTLVDGVEYVTFRFATPAEDVRYTVQASTRGSNQTWGESRVEAFDASGASLGTRSVVDIGQKNVSLLFDDAPIAKFTLSPSDGDGVLLASVQYSTCANP